MKVVAVIRFINGAELLVSITVVVAIGVVTVLVIKRVVIGHVMVVKILPIWTLSGLMSNTLTMRPMKLRMVLKLMRPMLQEPSTSSTMSAFAAVLH